MFNTFLAFNPIHSAVFYVSASSGNDSNSGSEESPWLTIEMATTVLVADDTVLVTEGEYEVMGTNTRYIPALNPISGTLENPIAIKTY